MLIMGKCTPKNPSNSFIESLIQPGLQLKWQGEGVEEVGYLDDKLAIRIDPKYYRPAEVETLLGDPSKAKKELYWSPKITFDELVHEMITSDLAELNGSAQQSMQE